MSKWTWVPPALTGRQVQGSGLLPFGRYRLPSGEEQVSFGLPQSLLDAVRGIGYATGYEQDPNAPTGYVGQEALQRGAEGIAGSATVGSLGARAPAGALRAGAARSIADDINIITPRSRELIEERVRGLMPQSTRQRLPVNIEREGRRFADDRMTAWNDAGQVTGTVGQDPQIKWSKVDPEVQGQGYGGELYRRWAEEAGGPFRSDMQVSQDAAAMYEQMLPRYGYNVLKNPSARDIGGTYWANDPAYPSHIYRVEPPGMTPSTEFYTNPLAGAVPLTMPLPQQRRGLLSPMA